MAKQMSPAEKTLSQENDALRKKLETAVVEKDRIKKAAKKAGFGNLKETVQYVKPQGDGTVLNVGCLKGSKRESNLIRRGFKPMFGDISDSKKAAAKKVSTKDDKKDEPGDDKKE